MRRPHLPLALVALAIGLSPLAAAPGDPVRTRIAGYRELGAAFKAMNDALRRSDASPGALVQPARHIREASARQYGWYPRGSGPTPGIKTAARPEIWTQPAKFKSAQDAFARQAQVLERATASGNSALVRTEMRKLGAACKACHDSFRTESD
ncbi:c-type cytochrome [Novosphingobium sp. ZW T3_23]|uniref:c-type cytochrome n=1 Tax=Novosphingobium sp. ZW T3_23 TaxID=3378084 RepID=UPI0038536E6F